MINQEKLAVKVMELANEFTHWNFQMEKEGNVYLVRTILEDQAGKKMTISYRIEGRQTQLTMASTNDGYDGNYIRERVDTLPQEYSVYIVKIGKEAFSINSPMPIEVLDSHTGTIVMKRMQDMLQVMTDILNYCS